MPYTMLGIAASSSIAMPSGRLSQAGDNSVRKQRDAEAHRNGDQQRDKRGDQGSVNRDQRAEDLVRRIPLFGPQKGKAKLLNAFRPGRDDQGKR